MPVVILTKKVVGGPGIRETVGLPRTAVLRPAEAGHAHAVNVLLRTINVSVGNGEHIHLC